MSNSLFVNDVLRSEPSADAAFSATAAATLGRGGGWCGFVHFLVAAIDGEADVLGYSGEGAIDVKSDSGLLDDRGIDLFLRLHIFGGDNYAERADLSELDGVALREFAL